jgi:hypothetical protein
VLLRVDYDAGHGYLGSSRAQAQALATDEDAFLLWQLGDPAFTPPWGAGEPAVAPSVPSPGPSPSP